MKHSMIWKSTFREIRGSLGRFLAILSITALGVGLFAGLKVTKADFLKSTTNYYQETQFYDYRILGELGFSQEQVDYFASLPDVRAAEGAQSYDMLYTEEGGTEKTGRFHSLTQGVNKVVLTAGRMPLREDECLLDAQYYGKNFLGKKIYLGDGNDEDRLSQFQAKEFVVVGIVKSPLYIQYERGSTSLGDGGIDAFVYLPKEAFAADYYTEVYLKFERDFALYSDAYDEYLDSREDFFADAVKEACAMRFAQLPGMIKDAEKELAQKRDEAWEELEDARRELEKAERELADAKEQIEDGREQLADGKEELIRAREELEDGKKTIAEKEAELEKGKKRLEDGQKKLSENETLLAQKEAEFTQAQSTIEASRMAVQLGEMQQKLTMEGLISEQKSIDSARAQLKNRSETADRLEAFAQSIGMGDYYEGSIAREREAIAKEHAELDKKLEDLHGRYLEALKTGAQIEEGKKELEAGEKQMQEGQQALLEGKEALLQGKLDLIDAQKQIEEGENALREAKGKLAQGEKDLKEGEKTLAQKESELQDGILEYEDGKKAYEDGLLEYQDGFREFEEEIAKAQDAIDKQKEKLDAGEAPEGYLLGRNTNIGYVCFENDSAIVDGIANVFPVFFFLVAALVCITTMNRMVEEQRTQIGVLKALGYSDGAIMFKYLFYSGTAAFAGGLIGFVFGTHFFPAVIWYVYGMMYLAGPIAFCFQPWLAFFSLSVSLLCSMGTTWFTCGKELGGWAAQLMRPRAPKAGKRVFLEYVPFIWKHLSFLRKVAVRNIMRYKKRLVMMVLGIGGCTGLLLTGFGIKDSVAGVGDMQFREIQTYDISILLKKEMDADFLKELNGLYDKGMESFLAFQETTQDLVGENLQKSVTVITLPEGMTKEELLPFVDLHTMQGAPLEVPGFGEAIITNGLADDFGISVGDTILLRDEDMRQMHLKVSGIAQNFIYNFVYLDARTWESERGEAFCPKSVYLKVKEGCEISPLSTAAMELPNVGNVTVTDVVLSRFNKMMSSLDLIVVVIIICAAGLAFIVLYNLTNINITERIREIATIKVLGFFSGETALYVFRENMVLTVLGAFAGLGMGKWLHRFVMHEVNVDMVSFDVRIYPASYVCSVLLTLVFALGVHLLMNHKLEEVNMTESLKSVD